MGDAGGGLFDLTGKVAVITGSSRGIGRAIAERMAEQGARVVVSSRKKEPCELVAEAINARHPDHAIAVPANISAREDLERLTAETRKAFGRIDILVLNAASNPHFGPILDVPDEAFRKIFENNVIAQNRLVQLVAPEMQARRDGAIVLISSIAGFRGSPLIGAYGVSKAADMALVRNLALELSPFNIRINAIAPGLVKTDFARAIWDSPAGEARAREATPLRRNGEPDDIAGVAVMLASRAGAWITGQTLVVDGGVMSV